MSHRLKHIFLGLPAGSRELLVRGFPVQNTLFPGHCLQHRSRTAKLLLSRRPGYTGYRLQSVVADAPTLSPPPSDTTPPSKQRSLPLRFLRGLAIFIACTTAGFAMAAAPAVETAQQILGPPSDEESLYLFTPDPSSPAAGINAMIIHHPIAEALRKDGKGWSESRPHMKIPPAMRPHNLTGGTLLGENKIVVPPLTFHTKDAALPEMVSLQFLGPDLCGHPGIIHGGFSATLLDEGLARCCFPALPNKVGVTASLKIDYKAPIMAEQIVVLRAETTKVEGRKVWVKGQLETVEGTILVVADGLFIEPRQAATMARIYSTQ